MNIGCMANDLADINSGDALDATADYGERSDARNALVLVQRLERDADDPVVLNPSRPITTLRSRTVFCNARPMPACCSYPVTDVTTGSTSGTQLVDGTVSSLLGSQFSTTGRNGHMGGICYHPDGSFALMAFPPKALLKITPV